MSDDTRYPLSQRLKMKSDAAMARGDVLTANELSDAAKLALEQESEANYQRDNERGGRERER